MTLKNKIEALLFSSGKPVPEEMLAQLTGETPKEIHKALKELKHAYTKREGALMIIQDESSWKITVREKYLHLVQRIVADTELSRATLETLAVIAYKAPMLQSAVIKTRGSGAYDHIAELLKLGFVSREKKGRSFEIKLAEKFFEYFDVEGSKDIKEALKDAKQPEPKPDQKKLGDLEVVDVPAEGEAESEPAEAATESLPEAPVEDKKGKTKLEKVVEEPEEEEDGAETGEDKEESSEEVEEEPEETEEETQDDSDTQKMLEEVEKEIEELTEGNEEVETDSKKKQK
ncbi:MAG: SMC-Scp complex subunit ScpB [archaeon]